MSLADWPFVLLGLIFLIASSAFFSGSETALMAVDRWRIRHLSRKGRRARLVEKTLKEPEKLIGTILLGNNLVNVAASALATAIAIKLVGEEGVIWSTLIMTLLILLFAEITPKTVAAYYPEQMSILIVQPIYVLIRLLYPIVRVLSAVSNKLIALLRLEKSGVEPILGIEEITAMIQVGAEEGVLKKRDEEMLQAVLALDRIPVESVMLPTRDVVAFEIDTGYEEVMVKVKESEFSRYPVYQESKSEVSGFVHIKDLFKWTGTPGQFSLKRIMRRASYVPEGKSLRQQLVDFQKSRIHLAFVVDEYGEVVGIVCLEDILEEIVGEIEDEHDVEEDEMGIVKRNDGAYIVKSLTTLEDFNEYFGVSFKEDADTIGGVVMTAFGHVPQRGEKIGINRFEFEVLRADSRRIHLLKVEPVLESA